MKGRIVLIVVGVLTGAALIAILTAFGFPPLFATAWLLLVVAVGIITRQPLSDPERAWPPAKPEAKRRGSDVSRLAWTINVRTGIVGHTLVRRIEALLRHRLELQGLDLDDPDHEARIDALLGPGIRIVPRTKNPQRSDIERVLDAIEKLPTSRERT